MNNREHLELKAVRNRLMWERREAGETLQEIGNRYHLTRERVRQILRRETCKVLRGFVQSVAPRDTCEESLDAAWEEERARFAGPMKPRKKRPKRWRPYRHPNLPFPQVPLPPY